jgi:predicted Zn-dependent protease
MSRLVALGLAVVCAACARTPYTNRAQLMLVSESEASELGQRAFQEVVAKGRVVTDPAYVEPVRQVGRRIAAASGARADWQFAVLDDPKVQNAFALPGGKVGVYTGMFPVAKDTAGLAVVMAHEVGHVLARHGSERMSQHMVQQLGGTVLGAMLGSGPTASAVLAAYGVGTQVGVLLPFSRAQESEADRIGLTLMANAGYDPERALDFWRAMEAAERRGSPPTLLSTHPSHETRLEDIEKWLPEARVRYQATSAAPVTPLPPVPSG